MTAAHVIAGLVGAATAGVTFAGVDHALTWWRDGERVAARAARRQARRAERDRRIHAARAAQQGARRDAARQLRTALDKAAGRC